MPRLLPGFGPTSLADDQRGYGDQLGSAVTQASVIVRVPTVAADQHRQASGGRIDHVQWRIARRVHVTFLKAVRVQLALRLPDWLAVAAEGQAAVVQRAIAGFQLATFDAGIWQHDGAGHQSYPELFRQAAEQCLIVPRHGTGLDAQVRVIHAVAAFGAEHRRNELQRIAPGQPLHRFVYGRGLIELILLVTGEQPRADVFRQHHHRLGVDQPVITRLLQIGRQLAVQSVRVLIIGGEQHRLDAQQVSALAGFAFIDSQTNAQVGQVVTRRALSGPDCVADEADDAQQD